MQVVNVLNSISMAVWVEYLLALVLLLRQDGVEVKDIVEFKDGVYLYHLVLLRVVIEAVDLDL